MSSNAARTAAGPSTPTRTPPTSVLCTISGETIFIATAPPAAAANATASSAVCARLAIAVGIP